MFCVPEAGTSGGSDGEDELGTRQLGHEDAVMFEVRKRIASSGSHRGPTRHVVLSSLCYPWRN